MPPPTDPARLFARIKLLNTLFFTLFFASIGVLVMQQTTFGMNAVTMAAWIITLGSAFAVRLYRARLIKQYKIIAPVVEKRPRAKKR